jgi:hypothetical protein
MGVDLGWPSRPAPLSHFVREVPVNSPWRLLPRERPLVVLALTTALLGGLLFAACTAGNAQPSATATITTVAPEGGETPEGTDAQVSGPRRGCLSCHQGEHSLASEVRTANPAHLPLPEDATVATCLSCHSDIGVEVDLSPILLSTILHPSHMFSSTFVDQLGGTCFSCHDVDSRGSFQLLGQEVTTNDKGVPNLEELAPDGSIRPTR